MRSFSITVNGKSYQVQVEETTGGAPIVQSVAPVAPPAPVAPAAPVVPVTPAAPAVSGGEPINAPMPGTILSVAVTPGQSVKKHDVLCVLEAMKMENEIVAPKDGTVAAVLVKKGDAVNSGDKLILLA
ncbi:MAG: biotin/lipoyl-binding protein [Oscillospiraceae bacterium]|jgi:glutaconyl-CoA decarboxylase|nr:biotin/lipoyl-binding protein [Oscillospiraceae bacterium]